MKRAASLTVALAAVLLAASAATDHHRPIPPECAVPHAVCILVAQCRDGGWCRRYDGSSQDSLTSTTVDNQYTIVNNTTTPATTDSNVAYAAGDLLYACGGTATLSVMAASGSDDLECSSTSILYRVPGEIGPIRLDKECDWDERETFTFSGSGSGVTAQRSCSAIDPT